MNDLEGNEDFQLFQRQVQEKFLRQERFYISKIKKQVRNRTIIMCIFMAIIVAFLLVKEINSYYDNYAYTLEGAQDDLFVIEDQNIDVNIDYVNELSTEVVRGTVRVNTTFYYEILGIKIIGGMQFGSGGIYDEDDDFYYILTNNHVVYTENKYKSELIVFDYKNRPLKGELINSSATYDLATIKIHKENDLKVLSLAEENPVVDELVVSFGTPKGQTNTIGFGIVTGIENTNAVTDSNVSNVLFPCIYHTFAAKPGNSGGVLLNTDNEIVGINTFGNEGDSSDYGYTAAVPIEKIIEFID